MSYKYLLYCVVSVPIDTLILTLTDEDRITRLQTSFDRNYFGTLDNSFFPAARRSYD